MSSAARVSHSKWLYEFITATTSNIFQREKLLQSSRQQKLSQDCWHLPSRVRGSDQQTGEIGNRISDHPIRSHSKSWRWFRKTGANNRTLEWSWWPSCVSIATDCLGWFNVSNSFAHLLISFHRREKVGQTIRDALHLQYRSSTKAKKKRRQAEQAKASANMTQISSTHFEISSKIDDLKSKVTDSRKWNSCNNRQTQLISYHDNI